jgi:ferric-dicitrate binding protein FerR (iron transport regulator)
MRLCDDAEFRLDEEAAVWAMRLIDDESGHTREQCLKWLARSPCALGRLLETLCTIRTLNGLSSRRRAGAG